MTKQLGACSPLLVGSLEPRSLNLSKRENFTAILGILH